jgi:AcrR family transcriptional regulator
MEQIAAECHMATNAIYYHFGSKEELLAGAVEQVAREIEEVLSDEGRPRASLDLSVSAIFSWVQMHPEKARAFFLWSLGASPDIARLRSDFVDRRVRGLGRFVARSPSHTSLDLGLDDDLAARVAISTAMSTPIAWLADDILPPDTSECEVAAAVTTTMTRLLGHSR